MAEVAAMTGEEMCEAILRALNPIVDGQPTEIVIEALAGGMLAAIMVGCPAKRDQRVVLRRYAARLGYLADHL